MPLYEYQCDACGHRFEVIQKFSDVPIAVCPKCGGAVQKLVSSPAFQFKGSGWYVTDYAKKDGGSKSESKGSQSSKDSGAGDSKDSKETSKKESGGTDTASSPATKPSEPAKG